MKIGYIVQGTADEAFLHGLARRWCNDAELPRGKFRGQSRESLRRELPKTVKDLAIYQACDAIVVLTDSDTDDWQAVKSREWNKIPQEYRHMTAFGVAERNIECWLAIDRRALANMLKCQPDEIPDGDDPSGCVKRRLGIEQRDEVRELAKSRITEFVAGVDMKPWINNSRSFKDFYEDACRLALGRKCKIPNELER